MVGVARGGGETEEGSAAWEQPKSALLSVRHWNWFGITLKGGLASILARLIMGTSTQREGDPSSKAAAHPILSDAETTTGDVVCIRQEC